MHATFRSKTRPSSTAVNEQAAMASTSIILDDQEVSSFFPKDRADKIVSTSSSNEDLQAQTQITKKGRKGHHISRLPSHSSLYSESDSESGVEDSFATECVNDIMAMQMEFAEQVDGKEKETEVFTQISPKPPEDSEATPRHQLGVGRTKAAVRKSLLMLDDILSTVIKFEEEEGLQPPETYLRPVSSSETIRKGSAGYQQSHAEDSAVSDIESGEAGSRRASFASATSSTTPAYSIWKAGQQQLSPYSKANSETTQNLSPATPQASVIDPSSSPFDISGSHSVPSSKNAATEALLSDVQPQPKELEALSATSSAATPRSPNNDQASTPCKKKFSASTAGSPIVSPSKTQGMTRSKSSNMMAHLKLAMQKFSGDEPSGSPSKAGAASLQDLSTPGGVKGMQFSSHHCLAMTDAGATASGATSSPALSPADLDRERRNPFKKIFSKKKE
ncbi:hypothetical protein HDU67_009040 [Dinochytrium kinnereticum]|nr:hypothetical protein HDU67_009040 [Dinochytrium kinnereticum]